MNPLETSPVACPYCGSVLEIEFDTVIGDYTFIEDCHICCRPVNFSITVSLGGAPVIEGRTDDE